MKNIFITLTILLFSITYIFGQDTLYVYKGGIINLKYPLSQIDSLSFSQASDSIKIHKNGSVKDKLLIASIDSIIFKQPLQSGSYIDIDGNVYTTVKIGTQTWMVENLKTTRFRNGDIIPIVTDGSLWVNTTTPARCDYNNEISNRITFGHLYNWYAASDNRIIAPAGWHVPTLDEWEILKNYLITNGYNYDRSFENNKFAKALASNLYWYPSNTIGAPGNNPNTNNSTGFNALPGGGRYGTSNGEFVSKTIGSFWWVNEEFSDIGAWYKALFYGYSFIGDHGTDKKFGYSIRCIKSDLAILTTTTISSITAYSANSGGNISYDGHDPITSRGLCWDTITNPTISKYLSLNGVGKGSFISSMSNLLPGKTYFARAYATNSVGTAYGNELNFTTLKTKPVLSTLPVSELTHNSVKTGGNISSNGGAQITSRGVCWSMNHNPVNNPDSLTVNGIGVGQYLSIVNGLSPNTTYYVRAYAINSEGISYGNEISIKTLSTIPTLTTTNLSSITSTSASSGGVITSNGGENVTARGVCWSIQPNPIVKPDSISTDGIGSGTFTSTISALQPGTTYYLRAYATNSVGTAYGNELSFKTLSTLPTLKTNPIDFITSTTATGGGEIITTGGENIIKRGVCWSVNSNPIVKPDSITTDGIGLGTFTSTITSLKPGTTYYIRAYATTSFGTAYGNEISFKTISTIPSVATNTISDISNSTAKSGGIISSNGGETVTARGICWSVNPNPTVKPDSTTIDGVGSGFYTSTITALLPGNTYYVRAYASNSVGTAYGNELSFKTLSSIPILSTSSVGFITTTSAMSGGEITFSGGEDISKRGVCWSVNPLPTLKPDSITTDGIGIGAFTSSITGINPGTTYYLRAYATNSIGTAYGNELSFKTTATTPTLSTASVISITTNSAVSGGNITTNGGENVTARGVCWNIADNPTIDNHSKTTDGSGNGIFVSNLSALLPATTYYVRAYATNSQGTSYGLSQSFTTLALP